MEQKLEKALIKILEGSKAGEERTVLFNPAEYSHEISNNFKETALPGLANPILQFVNGQSQTLSMDLFFDTWTDGGRSDVSDLTKDFAQLLAIDADLHAPPPVEFKWGSFAFKAVVEKLSQKFTMFSSGGLPVRATLSISFKQYRPLSEQLDDPRRNSSDKTKRRVLTADDSLWALAHREYGDVRYWRDIARHNRIDDPRLIEAGTELELPPLDEFEQANDDDAARA